MRYAFVSDIHGRTHVLERLLVHLSTESIDRVIVLGDVVHDTAYDILRAKGISGTFGNYEVSHYAHLSPENQRYVMGLLPILSEDGFLAAHAVPYHPPGLVNVVDFHDYMAETGIKWRKMFPYPGEGDDVFWNIYAELQTRDKRIFFHGHTHRQRAWIIDASQQLSPIRARKFAVEPGAYYIVGVGSLGVPEDDPHPGYALYDDEAHLIELRSMLYH